EQELERDVKEVAAATGGIENCDGNNFVLKGRELRAVLLVAAVCDRRRFLLRRRLSAVIDRRYRRGEFAFQFAPLAPQRRHQDWLDECHDVLFAGVMRTELRALIGVEPALEEVAHDAG